MTESLDNMLTESLKSRMPATSFQLFGIRQIEEQNMETCVYTSDLYQEGAWDAIQITRVVLASDQRKEELPTLLHFAARYGLKKLTTVLLQCPGALQAYSVMNKDGDYPNTLAEKSGFFDLRQFMDEYVVSAGTKEFSRDCRFPSDVSSPCAPIKQETAAILKSHLEEAINTDEGAEVYELMSASEDIMMKYSGCSEDIYESMLGIDPECAEDLCKLY